MARGSISLVIVSLLCLAFCRIAFSGDDSSSEMDWIRGFAKHTDKDNPVPRELVKKLEDDYRTATKDPKSEHDRPFVRHLMVVSTEMTQSRVRALKGPVQILTPPGGGTVDLADFVTPLKGAFNMKIRLENDHNETQIPTKVYFISQAKDRKIGEDHFGAGCDKYFDVTSFFLKRMAKDGFALYTADQRYLSVIRGTFVFVSYAPDALQLASLTFYDSRYTKWDCPAPEVL